MERSTVVNGKSGESVMSKTRTSSGMFLIRKQVRLRARVALRLENKQCRLSGSHKHPNNFNFQVFVEQGFI
jgi:hypothetical protein